MSLTLVAALGCPYFATFRKGSLGPIRNWPPSQEHPLSIALRLEGVAPDSTAYSETVRAYEDCGLFSIVRQGETADIEAEIAISTERESDYRGVLIDLSFGLFPIHHWTKTYNSRTSFISGPGEPITVSRSEQSNTWSHLFLIPLFPFMNPGRVERRIFYDLARETILAAQEAGAFRLRLQLNDTGE